MQLLQALTEIKALEKQDTNTQGKDINDKFSLHKSIDLGKIILYTKVSIMIPVRSRLQEFEKKRDSTGRLIEIF